MLYEITFDCIGLFWIRLDYFRKQDLWIQESLGGGFPTVLQGRDTACPGICSRWSWWSIGHDDGCGGGVGIWDDHDDDGHDGGGGWDRRGHGCVEAVATWLLGW